MHKPIHERHTQPRRRLALKRLIENDLIRRVSYDEYRKKVQRVYGGPQGALLTTASLLSLHIPLGERLFRTRRFDLRGMDSILDVGSGAGQIVRHLLKYSEPHTRIVGTDLSRQMLERARQRLKSDRPELVTADLMHLPFPDDCFDGVTCGYVLEHLPDPRTGLSEMTRVMRPGGRMLLLATEDSFSGAWTSRLWCCQTFNRQELTRAWEALGLVCRQELWFTKMHKAMKAGGICVELEKK